MYQFSLDDPIVKEFKAELHDRANLIDPENQRMWLDLTYGWAIAKGLDLDNAWDFALFIRYETDLG